MTANEEAGHELRGPDTHAGNMTPRSQLPDAATPRAARWDPFWLLVLAAVAATFAGVVLAIEV